MPLPILPVIIIITWLTWCERRASNIYAFGTVWYELLTGEWPWKEQPPEAIIWQVRFPSPFAQHLVLGKPKYLPNICKQRGIVFRDNILGPDFHKDIVYSPTVRIAIENHDFALDHSILFAFGDIRFSVYVTFPLIVEWPTHFKVGKGIRPTLANLQASLIIFVHHCHPCYTLINIFSDILNNLPFSSFLIAQASREVKDILVQCWLFNPK